MTFTWQGRRLATANAWGRDLSFKYNSDGIRTQKTVDGVTTYYTLDGSKIISQKTGNTEIFFEYDAAGNLATMIYNGQTYYYVHNLMGEIIALVDEDGNLAAAYYYDPWGEIINANDYTGDNVGYLNPFRYKDYYYDSETGFYYLNSRYYDPEICRFINADSVDVATATPMALTDKNLFAYCDNNPIVRIDVGGEFWDTVFDVVSLGFSIVDVAMNPYDPMSWIGLAGDVVDIIPFVTGVGETVKAIRFADKAGNTLEIAKAVDFTDDAADIVKTLDRTSGFTKSTRIAGTKIHKGYKAKNTFFDIGKEYRAVRGIRPDYVDFNSKTIYELKPNNPRAIKGGLQQLYKYNNALGGGYKLRLELY